MYEGEQRRIRLVEEERDKVTKERDQVTVVLKTVSKDVTKTPALTPRSMLIWVRCLTWIYEDKILIISWSGGKRTKKSSIKLFCSVFTLHSK